MNSTLTELLTLLVTIVSGLSGSSQIASVIATLQQIVQTGIAEIEAVGPFIKNIIAALKNNSAVTADQMTALEQLDQQTDAAFEAAAAAAGAPPAGP